jgi:predicted metal-dependent phosphoesterase TrpH
LIMIAELHCHSKSGKLPYFPLFYDAVQTVEEIIKMCLLRKIEILSITEHDSLEGYWQSKKIIDGNKLPIVLVPGCEISTSEGHMLAYGILKEIPPRLSANETIERVHQLGGIILAAHPFITFYSLKNKIYNLKIDGLEGYCSAAMVYANNMAVDAARKMKIPAIGGSDAHAVSGMGTGRTIFESKKIHCWQDVIMAIKKGQFKTEIDYQSWLKIGWDSILGNTKSLWQA